MWSVSAEREFRHKMPEVRIERIGIVPGWNRSNKDSADTCRNSPADSHLRDTGRSRSSSTKRHRRRRPVARAPHRKTRGSKDSIVEIRRSWDTACNAAVVKTFVYMRRSESTSSTNVVPLAISVWYVWCARATLVCCEIEAWQWLGDSFHSMGSVQGRTMKRVCVNCAFSIDHELTCVEGARPTHEATTSIYRTQRSQKHALEWLTRSPDWWTSHRAATYCSTNLEPVTPTSFPDDITHNSAHHPKEGGITTQYRHQKEPPTQQSNANAHNTLHLRHHLTGRLKPKKEKGDPTHRLGRFELPILQA
jgi:hypothetical protein